MSAPAGVTATTLQSGGPGSYVITYSWTLGSSPSALSFSVTLYSIIWGVTAIVKGPINYTSSQLSDTYTNTVTGASYYCIVTAYAGAGQTGASAQFQSQQVSVYNPYGGPQGVQGYQGVQGLQGPTGPVGQQGLQGVQGLMQVTNYATTNQLITTGGDSTHLTAYPLFTLNGTTLSLGAGANITTAGTSNSIGGVTLNNGAVSGVTTLNASGAIATSAGFTGPSINTDSTSSSKVSGVTLNNGALSGVTTLNASGAIATSAGFTGPSINTDSTSSSRVSGVTLNNGAVSGVTSLGMGGALSGATTLNASGAIATSAGFTGPSINTDSTSSSRVSGVTLNNGAVSGVTSLGMGGALSGVTTLNASGAIATSAGFTGPSFSATNFVTAAGGFTGPSSSTINGISIGLANQNVSGVGTLSCGAITAPSINNGANTFNVTATTGTNVTTMTVGAGNGTGYSISAGTISCGTVNGVTLSSSGSSGFGTISCGAITSSGALGLSTNGITSGTHNPSATDTYNLGITGTRWKQVVASNFTGALTGNADTATNVAYSGITGITSGSTFAGNAATATTAGGLTGTPAITVGAITGTSLALANGGITAAGAIAGVSTLTMTGALSGGTTISNSSTTTSSNFITGGATVSNSIGGVILSNYTLQSGSLGASSPPAPVSGLSLVNGGSYNPTQIEFHNGAVNGGYRHFITTAHSGTADSTGNRIEFWTNNSTTAAGSSAASVSNLNILTLTSGKPAAFTGGQTVSGSIGINQIIPTCGLDVNGAIACSNGLHVQAYANGYYNGAPTYGIGYSTTVVNSAAAKAVQISGFYGLTFATGGAYPNAISVDTSGRVGINTVSQAYTLDVNGSCRIWNGTTGLLATSGSTSWGTASDSNLKNVIAPITNATKSLELVTPVYYSWKSDDSNTQQVGVIAQEIQQAVPEAVGQFPIDSNDYLSVRFTELIPHLIASIKELSARLSNVEAQLART